MQPIDTKKELEGVKIEQQKAEELLKEFSDNPFRDESYNNFLIANEYIDQDLDQFQHAPDFENILDQWLVLTLELIDLYDRYYQSKYFPDGPVTLHNEFILKSDPIKQKKVDQELSKKRAVSHENTIKSSVKNNFELFAGKNVEQFIDFEIQETFKSRLQRYYTPEDKPKVLSLFKKYIHNTSRFNELDNFLDTVW
ncbi:hypothetical protein GKC56_03240 [Neisseriaceae bacterium PsAf]|nr:hypothetical protein [Neisseriaceae bacterium PsAf]